MLYPQSALLLPSSLVGGGGVGLGGKIDYILSLVHLTPPPPHLKQTRVKLTILNKIFNNQHHALPHKGLFYERPKKNQEKEIKYKTVLI